MREKVAGEMQEEFETSPSAKAGEQALSLRMGCL
jgi:hypothetical protein